MLIKYHRDANGHEIPFTLTKKYDSIGCVYIEVRPKADCGLGGSRVFVEFIDAFGEFTDEITSMANALAEKETMNGD